MAIDWKKIATYAGVAAGVSGVGYWLYQYQQTAAANSAANQAAASQDQNQALAALLQEPLSGGGSAYNSSEVSGPTVDTGNSGLQSLIDSILNPTSGTVSETPTPSSANPLPVGGGGNPVTITAPLPVQPNTPIVPTDTGPATVSPVVPARAKPIVITAVQQ